MGNLGRTAQGRKGLRKLAAATLAALILVTGISSIGSRAAAPATTDEPKTAIVNVPPAVKKVAPNPLAEFRNVPIPSVKWVIAKGQCETGLDWRNGGTYAGAWGFMHRGYETDASGLPNNSSWGRWGGFEFARHPSRATPTEQVIVYLRINFGGWHRPNGAYRPPSGSLDVGNNCYQYANRVAGKLKLRVRNLDNWYRTFRTITYLRAVATSRS